MHLDVSKAMVAEGQELPFSATIALPDTAVWEETVHFVAPVLLRGTYSSVGDAIRVKGTLGFEGLAQCMRCLTPSSQTYETEYDVLYVLAARDDNPDLYLYDGAWIDLTAMAADAAQLALPMQWLCRADCLGLCPICGADQNTSPCSCRKDLPEKENPFAALQQLLTKDESEV